MSIFKKTFFDHRNSAQKQADYETYRQYMFPLGSEQRDWITKLLAGAPKKAAIEKSMYTFFICKEKYLETKMEGHNANRCREECHKFMGKRGVFVPKVNLAYIFALLMLDLQATSEENYPTIPEVRKLQEQLFPESFNKPNFHGLPPITGDTADGQEQ